LHAVSQEQSIRAEKKPDSLPLLAARISNNRARGAPLHRFFSEWHQDQVAREKQLAVQIDRNLSAIGHGLQFLPGEKEKAFRRIKLTPNGEWDAAVGFKRIRVGFVDDPCLRGVHEDPAETLPDAIAETSLPILPGPDERPFMNLTGARVQFFVHRFGSVLSSRARSSATSGR